MKQYLLAFSLMAVFVLSCRNRQLSHSCTSIDELAGEALSAIASGDADALDDLRITRHEFQQYLWPEFPASRNNVPVDFAWDNLNGKCVKGIRRAVADFGSHRFVLDSVIFREGVVEYATFRIHTNTVLHVHDQGGVASQLTFCGSVIERDGEYKFLSFNDR